MMQVSEFRERLNQFLHRQDIRKLTDAERFLAREWCLNLIHREHPEMTDEQAELFYENLINVRVVAVERPLRCSTRRSTAALPAPMAQPTRL